MFPFGCRRLALSYSHPIGRYGPKLPLVVGPLIAACYIVEAREWRRTGALTCQRWTYSAWYDKPEVWPALTTVAPVEKGGSRPESTTPSQTAALLVPGGLVAPSTRVPLFAFPLTQSRSRHADYGSDRNSSGTPRCSHKVLSPEVVDEVLGSAFS